jgi:hypothetical protein
VRDLVWHLAVVAGAAAMSDAWEALRWLTLDELVTKVKLAGSAACVHGATTPEGYPFVIVVAVAAPGNERAVELAREFNAKMAAAVDWSVRVDREPGK